MKMTPSLAAPPPETATDERVRAASTWKVLGAESEDLVNDKLQLDRLDRTLVATRKQAVAAKNEAQAVKAQLEQATQERYPASVVWGLGLATLASVGGWLYNRRKLVALQAASLLTVPPEPVSEFRDSDLSVKDDEISQWADQVRVAEPAPDR